MSPEVLTRDHIFPDDESVMRRALLIARQGRGCAEPNPLVGAVIVDEQRRFISEGWHAEFGSDHAEIVAIQAAPMTAGTRLFVTLEPCSHHGQTPPCADAVIAAGFTEVVIGCRDPAPHVSGRGISRLQEFDISVVTGVCGAEACQLIAPFSMLQLNRRPWIHAKWAMTLDGRIAASSGHSKWITSELSRRETHRLRGVMDAIITGAGTIRSDDPELTARPAGPRVPTRIVLDSGGNSIHAELRLIATLAVAPVLVCLADDQTAGTVKRLGSLGAEVLQLPRTRHGQLCMHSLLQELGRRNMTNVLVEAGAGVLGAFFDAQLMDEVHAFIAPKLIGGAGALSPIGGTGLKTVPVLPDLETVHVLRFGDDILIRGRICRPRSSNV